MDIKITSDAFQEGDMIPKKHTCDGINISPQLAWEGVPEGTETLALINDDPDAPMGTWVHWVVFDIPAHVREIPENVPPERELGTGGKQGVNDFGKIGYGGPCPPSGTHRYYFKLYALDSVIGLERGATKDDLLKAMEGHILAQGQLMGRYSR
ncbi:MAG: YbhB/YbcL family Raf kinase inhibitor-like protein [Candidatus Aminicenantes bacterium]|jgi:Raf kinase inhibitor-like YbhB/YbcL family protein